MEVENEGGFSVLTISGKHEDASLADSLCQNAINHFEASKVAPENQDQHGPVSRQVPRELHVQAMFSLLKQASA